LIGGTITLCSGLPLEHALGILPTLDLPEQERKETHALEKNGNAHHETQLLRSDSHCALGQSGVIIRHIKSGNRLSSPLQANGLSILHLFIAV
jgi:hypothetical protein